MEIINGDILTDLNPSRKTVIAHGCNCFHTMGAGIALYLKNKYPQILDVDKKTPRATKDKLGTYSKAIINQNLHILNCYTQFAFGGKNIKHARYWAIEQVFEKIEKEYDASYWEVRMPMIGCGLAGGDWKEVRPMIDKYFFWHKCKVYYL